jgi:hypothetical protein
VFLSGKRGCSLLQTPDLLAARLASGQVLLEPGPV